jgi:hypothetical protein
MDTQICRLKRHHSVTCAMGLARAVLQPQVLRLLIAKLEDSLSAILCFYRKLRLSMEL